MKTALVWAITALVWAILARTKFRFIKKLNNNEIKKINSNSHNTQGWTLNVIQ